MKYKFGAIADPNNKELIFYRHQLDSLAYYLNIRLGQACETCENVICSKMGKYERNGEVIKWKLKIMKNNILIWKK